MKKIKRKILGFLSFSTALFIFQACYGMPQDLKHDVFIEGIVKSSKTNQPIPGIKVLLENRDQSGITDSLGKFQFYTWIDTTYKIKFEDIDSLTNGSYKNKDTLIGKISNHAFLEIALEEK